jgi:hypothetical protein
MDRPEGWVRDATGTEIRGSYVPQRDPVPDGYRVGLFTEDDRSWTVPAPFGARCRYVPGPGHRTCGRPAVVALLRGKARWGYCDLQAHLYGRVYDPGPPPRLLSPRLYQAPTPPTGTGDDRP